MTRIAKVSPDGIELAIKPEDIKIKTIQGALEAVATGSAKFLKGAVTIDFTLTAWGVVDPSDTGLRARYAVRDFQIHKLLASWKDHDAPFSVDHSDALASLVLKMIKELPETTLKVPAIRVSSCPSRKAIFRSGSAMRTQKSIQLAGRRFCHRSGLSSWSPRQ